MVGRTVFVRIPRGPGFASGGVGLDVVKAAPVPAVAPRSTNWVTASMAERTPMVQPVGGGDWGLAGWPPRVSAPHRIVLGLARSMTAATLLH